MNEWANEDKENEEARAVKHQMFVRSAHGSQSGLSAHPWRTLLIILAIQGGLLYLLGFFLQAVIKKPFNISNPEALTVVLAFTLSEIIGYLIVPYFLGVPFKRQTFKDYLDDIRLIRFRPFFPLFLLTISCLVVLILCQGGGSIVYRLTQGKPVTGDFLRGIFDLGLVLPPRSFLLFAFAYTMLEEVVFRGVLLRLLLNKHPVRLAIIYSALAFGLAHLPAALAGRSLVLTLGQVVWAAVFGLFYAYLVIKTDSLIPAMIIHWLINVFQEPLTACWATMPTGLRTLYGVTFGYGLATLILIPCVRFFTRKLLPPQKQRLAAAL
jgi:membrane protease YdiL (CAAX protease family)